MVVMDFLELSNRWTHRWELADRPRMDRPESEGTGSQADYAKTEALKD